MIRADTIGSFSSSPADSGDTEDRRADREERRADGRRFADVLTRRHEAQGRRGDVRGEQRTAAERRAGVRAEVASARTREGIIVSASDSPVAADPTTADVDELLARAAAVIRRTAPVRRGPIPSTSPTANVAEGAPTTEREAPQPGEAAAPSPRVLSAIREQTFVEFAQVSRTAEGGHEFMLGLTGDVLGGLRLSVTTHGERRVAIRVLGGDPDVFGVAAIGRLASSLEQRGFEVVDVDR